MLQHADILPIFDLFQFGPFLHGQFHWQSLICALMYHVSYKKPRGQVVWMQLSFMGHLAAVMALDIIYPTIVVIKYYNEFHEMVWALIIVLVIVNIAEFKILQTKLSIIQHAKNKVMISN